MELSEKYHEPRTEIVASLAELMDGPPVHKLLFSAPPDVVQQQLKAHWAASVAGRASLTASQVLINDVVSGARRQAASARTNVALMMSLTNGGLHHPLIEVHCCRKASVLAVWKRSQGVFHSSAVQLERRWNRGLARRAQWTLDDETLPPGSSAESRNLNKEGVDKRLDKHGVKEGSQRQITFMGVDERCCLFVSGAYQYQPPMNVIWRCEPHLTTVFLSQTD